MKFDDSRFAVREAGMRWPIRYQILVPFGGMMLTAVVTVSLLNAYWAAARTQRDIEDRLRGVASTLLGSTFPLTAHVLEQMHGLSGADFIVTDGSSRKLATSGLTAADLPPLDRVTDRWEDLRLGPVVTLGDDRFFHVALRADRRGGGPDRALLHILYPERVLREARRQAAWPPLVVGGVALALCVALASWIARRLSLPLLQVRTQVGRIAEGNYEPLAIPARNDEVRDVATSVNEMARQLDESRRAIVRAERLTVLGRLSGGLAHHLRNDVTGALMAIQMHRRHCQTSDQESLDVALRQLSLIENHLKRFLAAGQPERPWRQTFDVHELVGELYTLLAPSARHRRVELTCDRGEAPVLLHADTDQVRQALMNLVLNALEAVSKGGHVKIELVPGTDRVALRVMDDGPGLAEEMTARLGEAFQTTKPEGVGLGLAIVRQVAEGHGGSLRYTRTNDVTCFELSLPLGAAESEADPLPSNLAAGNRELTGIDHE